MKDITAILVHYPDQAALDKALNSLKRIDPKLNSIIVLREQKMSPNAWSDKIKFVTAASNDHGQKINDIICKLTTSYVLFLQDTDYLSPTIPLDSLQLSDSKTVLATVYHNQNIAVHHPLLVRTSLLKKKTFLHDFQLPFKEALFPAWLSNVERTKQSINDNLIRQSRKNSSKNTIEKEKIMQKYQLKKTKTEHPTISVLISTYNMESYVETAVFSCILQNETFDQILIIDDGSTDNSYQRLQQWDDEKRVKVFHKKNEGKANALNELLSYVTSDFTLELDADDWLDPDACAVIKAHLSDLPKEVSVLYGNLRKWKQLDGDVLFKGVAKGVPINGTSQLLSYRFPLGPRIYRTSALKEEGGFPVIDFADGRLYEDVSVLNRLLKKYPFRYKNFTVYNVREHNESITKNNDSKWDDFLKMLQSK